jgi:hypothetical protein
LEVDAECDCWKSEPCEAFDWLLLIPAPPKIVGVEFTPPKSKSEPCEDCDWLLRIPGPPKIVEVEFAAPNGLLPNNEKLEVDPECDGWKIEPWEDCE